MLNYFDTAVPRGLFVRFPSVEPVPAFLMIPIGSVYLSSALIRRPSPSCYQTSPYQALSYMKEIVFLAVQTLSSSFKGSSPPPVNFPPHPPFAPRHFLVFYQPSKVLPLTLAISEISIFPRPTPPAERLTKTVKGRLLAPCSAAFPLKTCPLLHHNLDVLCFTAPSAFILPFVFF